MLGQTCTKANTKTLNQAFSLATDAIKTTFLLSLVLCLLSRFPILVFLLVTWLNVYSFGPAGGVVIKVVGSHMANWFKSWIG